MILAATDASTNVSTKKSYIGVVLFDTETGILEPVRKIQEFTVDMDKLEVAAIVHATNILKEKRIEEATIITDQAWVVRRDNVKLNTRYLEELSSVYNLYALTHQQSHAPVEDISSALHSLADSAASSVRKNRTALLDSFNTKLKQYGKFMQPINTINDSYTLLDHIGIILHTFALSLLA